MADLKCIECGNVFKDNLQACPECGCPANECKTIDNNSSPTLTTVTNKDQKAHTTSHTASHTAGTNAAAQTFELNYSYVDFSWFKWGTSDPFLLKLLMDCGPLRWLFSAWHVGGENPTNAQQAWNEIFFIANRLFKFWFYPMVWVFFKMLIPILIMLIIFVGAGAILFS